VLRAAGVNVFQQIGQVRSGSAGTVVHRLAQAAGVVLVSTQPIGRPVDADHSSAVQEPIEHGRGDGGVTERAGPIRDADIGAQNRRRLQISLVDHLEQRGRSVTG
jgi:hypothetical protein